MRVAQFSQQVLKLRLLFQPLLPMLFEANTCNMS
jgi:hypothetical protein